MLRQNVTAIYRRHASADLVRNTLRDLDISIARIHVIPDRPAGMSEETDFGLYDEVIRDLELSEADIRLYQDAVRRGDFVVSVNVDEDQVAMVEEAMRHSEPSTEHDETISDIVQEDNQARRMLEQTISVGR